MHMMFVDESGDLGYPKDGNWAKWQGSKIYTRLGKVFSELVTSRLKMECHPTQVLESLQPCARKWD
jgi:hypothetical protein